MNVYPRQALEAKREDDRVRVWISQPDNWQNFTVDRFDELFVPAERLDALIEAARNAVRYNPNGGDWIMDLREALHAYDEGQEQ